MKRRKSARSRTPSWRRRLVLWPLVLLLVAELTVSLVPYAQVPDAVRPAYAFLLRYRNQVLARLPVELERYPSSARVEAAWGGVDVYFAPSPTIGRRLADFIGTATQRVDVCIFDLDLPEVVDALVAARHLGREVRIITDSDNFKLPALEPLKRAGIAFRADGREPFMHNKFVVVDERAVWTGSFNFTRNCATKNDNNALILRSPLLAANYTAEFDEMWGGAFGPQSPVATPNPHLKLGDLAVENYFAAEDRVLNRVIAMVGEAQTSVDMMAFAFTAPALREALEAAMKRGVHVRALFDAGQAGNQSSQADPLRRAGAEVRLSLNRRGVMHHKVILVDGTTVITGSFNFSHNADRNNDENLLVLRSSALAAIYAEEFFRCWTGMKGY